ncbi:hypothetical protein MAR_002625 [Mya arenaria]|uniref:Uncharacterized protein n=1 Tax=Mya arenaria TaxID=6604 RepID=A0ABY7G562_MYAAR|nr:hypothetical protein MAR_002625 [Mya arenaria]
MENGRDGVRGEFATRHAVKVPREDQELVVIPNQAKEVVIAQDQILEYDPAIFYIVQLMAAGANGPTGLLVVEVKRGQGHAIIQLLNLEVKTVLGTRPTLQITQEMCAHVRHLNYVLTKFCITVMT